MSRRGRKRTSGSFGRSALIAVLGLVIGLSIYRLNAAGVVGEDMPMPFGCGAAVVMSGSMDPALRVDDLVIVHAREEYVPGDIVVYEGSGALIVHRILSIEGDTVVTQGDANNIPDEPFSVGRIRGAVICRIPGVGRFFGVIRTPLGTAVILICAVFLFLVSLRRPEEREDGELAELREELNKLREEKRNGN